MSKVAIAILVSLTIPCTGKEVGKMLDVEISLLSALLDENYVKARDVLISKNTDALANSTKSQPSKSPDLRSALQIRARFPEKAAKFTGALTLEHTDYLSPRLQAKNPNSDQILLYLDSLGQEFAPLVEEYLYHLPASLESSPVRAGAMFLHKISAERAESVATGSFSKFAGNEPAQKQLATAVESTKPMDAKPFLWSAYRSTKDAPYRYSVQFILAKFGDADMKREIERILNDANTSESDRDAAVRAYPQYLSGDYFGKHVAAFRQFKLPATRMEITTRLTPSSPPEAKVLESLIAETKEKEIQDNLRENLNHYKSMAGEN